MREAGAGSSVFVAGGSPPGRTEELTELSDGPQARGRRSVGPSPHTRSPSPAPAGITLSLQTSGGPRNLNALPSHPFMPTFCHFFHLAPSAFFFFPFSFSFPPFVSSSLTEGHKSGFRGKIWRRWELSSFEERLCRRDFWGGEAAREHLRLPAPLRPASLHLPGSPARRLEVRGHFAGFGGRTWSSSR